MPTMINPDPVCIVLARSFLNAKVASPTAKDALPAALSAESAATAVSRQEAKPKATKARSSKKATRGRYGPLRGRWLELLSETYLDAVEPPETSVVSFLTPQLRLFRDGETEMARMFLRDVIDFMRSQHWTFSDRLQNDPQELARTLDHICVDRTHKAIEKELKKVDATRNRLDRLGFDGSFASLLKSLEARRKAGRFSGAVDRPVVENEAITTAACAMMVLTKTDHHGAMMLVQRILNHVAQHSELAYSVLNEIAHTMGVTLSSHDKQYKAFSILIRHGLIVKVKNYSRCAAWSIGNQYAITEEVQFVVEEASRGQTQGQGESSTHHTTQRDSCNNTISRFQTPPCNVEPLDMTEIALEAARLRANKRFIIRLRNSRSAGCETTK
jgi:hypothetical protein